MLMASIDSLRKGGPLYVDHKQYTSDSTKSNKNPEQTEKNNKK